MRDSIIFYRSFYEAINELPLNIQAKVYQAIFEYSLNFNEVALSGLPKTIFTLIKPQLDANNKRFENGSKGGRKKTETEPKTNQTETKAEANNNVNNNVNNNQNVNENDECESFFFDDEIKTKNFLLSQKITIENLARFYKLDVHQVNLKIHEFVEKKFRWEENTWASEKDLKKNFEFWLKENGKSIVNPYKSWNAADFKAECEKHKKEFGAKTLTEFFRYWNQPTETGVMRFQEKTAWDTEQQLKIWRSNGK